jgi:hypothetical protein
MTEKFDAVSEEQSLRERIVRAARRVGHSSFDDVVVDDDDDDVG